MSKVFWGLVFVLLIFAAMFPNKSNNTIDVPIDRNSPEYKYAERRLKLEGFGAKESKQAAEAIYKFHKVQQYRRDGIIE